MKKRQLKRILGWILVFMSLLTVAGGAVADGGYDYKYVGIGETGNTVGQYLTALLRLKDTADNTSLAYCVDSTTYIVNNSLYSRADLAATDYFDADDAAKIRGIVKNAYPFMTMTELIAKSAIPTLTSTQAITAAQLAIWKIANDAVFTQSDPNVTALYNWYMALAPITQTKTPIGTVQLTAACVPSGSAFEAIFRYSTDGVNVDGSPVALTHTFDKDVTAEYGATVSAESLPDGVTEVRVTGVPADAQFSIRVSGTQQVAFDGYLYQPQGGRCTSQVLVGAYEGDTSLYAEMPYTCDDPGEYSIRVYKYDSTTGAGIEGAVFQLANNEAFTSPTLYEKTTNQDGYAEFSGLREGRWYLREKTAPIGYVPDTEIYFYDIDEVPIDTVRFKNTHYGQIEIIKVDETGGPVAGAKFNIYRGDSQDASDLLYADLVTDETGLILRGELIPGGYTVVETEAPIGYHLSDEPVSFVTVNPHETAVVSMVNHTVTRGKIGVAKENYETGERLVGAVIGIYSDESCETKLAEFVTTVEPQYLEGLLPGTYYVKELEAPDGYILNPTQQVVTVELEEGEEELVVFRNRPRIDTAGNYGILLLIGAALVLVSGTLTVIFRKRLFKH